MVIRIGFKFDIQRPPFVSLSPYSFYSWKHGVPAGNQNSQPPLQLGITMWLFFADGM